MSEDNLVFVVVDNTGKWWMKLRKPFTDRNKAEAHRQVQDESYPETAPHKVLALRPEPAK